jgi:hypothetical protein
MFFCVTRAAHREQVAWVEAPFGRLVARLDVVDFFPEQAAAHAHGLTHEMPPSHGLPSVPQVGARRVGLRHGLGVSLEDWYLAMLGHG